MPTTLCGEPGRRGAAGGACVRPAACAPCGRTRTVALPRQRSLPAPHGVRSPIDQVDGAFEALEPLDELEDEDPDAAEAPDELLDDPDEPEDPDSDDDPEDDSDFPEPLRDELRESVR